MRTGRKIGWIAVWTVIVLVAVSLAGAVFLYCSPDAVKRLLESVLSSISGAHVEMGGLRYGVSPLEIEVFNVRVRSGEAPDGLILSVQRARGRAAFEGRFGRRRLVIRSLQVDEPVLDLSGEPPILNRILNPPAESPFSRLAGTFFSFWLFKELQVESMDLSKGRLSWEHPGMAVRLDEITAKLRPESGGTASYRLEAASSRSRTRLRVPSAGLSLPEGFSSAQGGIPFEMHFEAGDLEGPSVSAGGIALRLKAVYRAEAELLALGFAEGRAKAVSVNAADVRFDLPVSLELPHGAEVDFEKMRAAVPHFVIQAGEGLDLAGSAAAAFGDSPEWRLDDLSGAADLEALTGSLTPPEWLGCVTGLSGTLRLRGGLAARLGEEGWRLMPDLQANVDEGGLSCRLEGCALRADVVCGAAIRGVFPRPDISAEFTGNGIELEGPAMSLSGAAIGLIVEGAYPVFQVRGIALRVPRFRVRTSKGSAAIQPIDVDVPALGLNVLDGTVDLADFTARISGWEGLRGSMKASSEGVSAAIGAKEMLALFGGSALGLIPRGWKIEGRDAFAGHLSYTRKAGFRGDFDWALEEIRFEGPDGLFMGEGIGLDIQLQGSSDRQGRRIQVDMQAGSKKGEILYDRWYMDLGRRSLSGAIQADYLPATALMRVKKGGIDAAALFDASFSGAIERLTDSPAGRLEVEVKADDLSSLVTVFLKEPFQEVQPLLGGLDVAGRSNLSLTLDWMAGGWQAKGLCAWNDGALRVEEMGVELEGLDLRLPVWAAGGSRKEAGGAGRLEGGVAVRRAVFPYATLEGASWKLEAEPNGLRVDTSIDLSVTGGRLRVEGLDVTDLYSADVTLKTSVETTDLNVGRLLAEFWPRPVEGALNGRLDPVIMTREGVQTIGELRVDLFGGQWVVSDPGLRALFTPAPVFRLDARWLDVQLGLLTAGTPFGKMEGVLEGRINGLEIAAGQPQAFDLLMESVPREGVPQRISVEAVDSISRIGGGRSPFLGLAGGFASLFKEFPYSKMGVHATLENDLFRIDGTIQEGGKEYLVKKKGLVGVDVVNQSPGSRIRFKDMVKRIQRIRSDGSGPVID